MQLSYFSILLAGASSIIARPTTNVGASNDVHVTRELQDRAVIPTIASIVTIISGVTDLVNGIVDDVEAAKADFTQRTRDNLMNAYPEWNVLVFHEQSSPRSLNTAYCQHLELPLDPTGITDLSYGYEVCVFRDGWFQLAGDGGYANWASGGCTAPTELGERYLQYSACF